MGIVSLIGRDAEVDEVHARTRTSRLVTVVGPGGVGKTALARAVAAHVEPMYPLGVRHVDLTRIDDGGAVRGALAAQLGFDSFDALLASPSDRPMLLVVDNCEHVLDEVAGAVAQVLGVCQQPVVIATSRTPLDLPGESIVSLSPLALPEHAADPRGCPSVELFLRRSRDAGATTDERDLEVVAELCRRVDGLPLAIEIAAARTRTMSVADILARLDETIDVLERPRFRGDPRHRSIADTIRWSYELLSPAQAHLLERLSVFTGPFTAERAEAMHPEGGPIRGDLDELIDASLVVIDDRTVPTRYRLLDTVRRFGLDQLRRRGELEATYDRFVDHVQTVVRGIVAGATATWRPGLMSDLVAHYDDIAAAIGHAIAHDPSPRRAYGLSGILWGVTHQAHADDIAALSRRTLARWPPDGSAGAARAVATLATAEYVTGHPARAAAVAAQALADERERSVASVTLHRALGQARRALGDLDGAIAALEAGARIGRALGMDAMALELDVAGAVVTADRGDVEGAVAALGDVLDRADAIGSTLTSCWARTCLGWVLLRLDVRRAIPVIDDALLQARAIDYPIGIAVGLRSRAFAALLDGRGPDAVATIGELLDDLMARGALSNSRLLADVTAAVAHRCGHPAWERLIATARALPITTLPAARFELVALPATSATVLGRHEVVATVRHVLIELSTAAGPPEVEVGTGTPSSAPAATPANAPAASIVPVGDVYELTFAGRTIAVRASKGVADIVRLIGAGGGEVHCLDLAGAAVDEVSTGETIDVTARRQYEQRIRDLQAGIDEAEGNSDFELAYRHQVELDLLVEHLAAAVGHGGRTRRSGGTAERARSAVTHRIRGTIRHLTKLHPQLGTHLDRSISTGTYCSYRPERPVAWHLATADLTS